MATFNLSLVDKPAVSEVQASKELTVVDDPKTGAPEKETITEGGITIDKSIAPKLQLAGAVGHAYTELLNKELSIESMGAIIAAVDTSIADADNSEQETGKIQVDGDRVSILQPDNDTGYIFVAEADNLGHTDFREISQKFLEMRNKNPNRRLGLALIPKDKTSPTMETLRNCLTPAGISVVYTQEGLTSMVKTMLKE